jgi:hypothetical protein
MTKKKSGIAVNKGTCQCCGNLQKLPSGMLSTHGYTKAYGWFEGICPGSGYLPFEQSYDLIERFIEGATSQLGFLNAERIKVLNPTDVGEDTIKTKYNVFVPYTNGVKSHYVWLDATLYGEKIVRETYTTIQVSVTYRDPNNLALMVTKKEYGHDLEEARKTLNARYLAQSLDKRIKATEDYISWQMDRVANWQPQELKPL